MIICIWIGLSGLQFLLLSLLTESCAFLRGFPLGVFLLQALFFIHYGLSAMKAEETQKGLSAIAFPEAKSSALQQAILPWQVLPITLSYTELQLFRNIDWVSQHYPNVMGVLFLQVITPILFLRVAAMAKHCRVEVSRPLMHSFFMAIAAFLPFALTEWIIGLI